jgi:hypothetical protein
MPVLGIFFSTAGNSPRLSAQTLWTLGSTKGVPVAGIEQSAHDKSLKYQLLET